MGANGEKLTGDRAVSHLAPPAQGRQRLVWDEEVSGFGVRITVGGSRSFVLNYRVRGSGQERRFTIGSTETWKLAAARQEARRLRKVIDLGGDPLGDLEAERAKAAAEKLKSKSVNDLCDEFETEHLPSLRPASRKFYRLAIKNHVRPDLGKKRIEDVGRADIEKTFKRLTDLGQRHQANQVVTICGVLFRYAIKWGWRTGDNPAREVDRHTLEGRERYLTPAETTRLAAALDKIEDKQAAALFRVLQLTGARVGETLKMRWEQIDFQRGLWTKPASTTKQKKVHRLPLTAPVLLVLSEVKRQQTEPSGWVFHGHGKQGYRIDLRAAWAAALKEAEIKSLRIHDLRHSFASTLVGSGYSLPMIGAALGHSRVETTQRYAHLADDPLREAMTRAADLIEAASKSNGADIVPLRVDQR